MIFKEKTAVLKEFWQAVTRPSPLMQSIEGRQLSRLLAVWLLLFWCLIILLFFLRTPVGVGSEAEIIVRGILSIIILVAYFLNRKGHYKIALNLAIVSSSLLVILLATLEGGQDGMQVLNYLSVILLFSSLFFAPGAIFIIFIGHLLGISLFTLLSSEIAFLQAMSGPISLNLTFAMIVYFVTRQRNQLGILRQMQTSQERNVFRILAQATIAAKDEGTLSRDVLSYLLKVLNFDLGIVTYPGRKEQQVPVMMTLGTELETVREFFSLAENSQEEVLSFFSQEPIFAPDISHSSLSDVQKNKLTRMGIQALVSCPLAQTGKGYEGIMHLATSTPKELLREHETFYETIAQMFAAALEHKRAEEAVSTSEERFRRLAHSSPDIILIIDQSTTNITFINKKEPLGYPPETFGKLDALLNLVHPDEIEQVRNQWHLLMQAPDANRQNEFRVQRENGEWEWIESHITTLANDREGMTRQFLLFMTIVTERKQIVAAQKMESLGVLAGGVAHDFNNLLVAILGQASLASHLLSGNDSARPHIEKVVTAAESAATLTRQLLAYSGRGHFQIRSICLNKLIEENLHLFRIAVPKHVKLKSNLNADLPAIEADMGQMQQVIMNLILNGAEAVGEAAGTVTVETNTQTIGVGEDQNWLNSSEPLEPGLYVSLVIHDDGKGMDSQTLTRIFEPFFTTKATGRGLGLAAVLGIIRGHQGRINVNSVVGKGSTFKLLFPASTETVDDVEKNHTVPASTVPDGTVLVIDDEESVREAVADILAMQEITVIGAANGNDGVALYNEHKHEIELVLLDLSMPGMNGYHTLVALQKIDPTVRVILSSGYDEAEAMRQLKNEQPTGFLHKPYNLNQLLKIVKEHLPSS